MHNGRLRRPGVSVPTDRGKRGQDTRMVSCPLLTPLTFLWTRLPSVARLNARGPQGRPVIQEYTLDRSGAFRSAKQAPYTVWPRTVMRGELRKVNSGHNSVPKSARRTEPSPRNPRFAAHLRCVSAKEGKGRQEGTGNHTWCPVPFCLCRETPAIPPPWARRFLRRQTAALPAAEGGNSSPVNTGNPVPPSAAIFTMAGSFHPSHRSSLYRAPS